MLSGQRSPGLESEFGNICVRFSPPGPGTQSCCARLTHFPEAEPNSPPHCTDSAGYGSSNFPPGFVNQSKAVVLLPLSPLCQGKAFQAGDLLCAHVYTQVRKTLSLVPS